MKAHCSLLITTKYDIQRSSVPEHTALSKCSLIYSSTVVRNGRFVDDRYRNNTEYPYWRKYLTRTQSSDNQYSALVAPLVPVEKLSMNRTVFFSSGTVVPPDVTITTFLLFETALWTKFATRLLSSSSIFSSHTTTSYLAHLCINRVKEIVAGY